MGRKQLSFFMAFILAMTLFIPLKITAFAEAQELTGTAELETIEKYGNIDLSLKCSELLDAGYTYGDILNVSFLDQALELPLCSNFANVDTGEPAIFARDEDEYVVVAINMGDFATTYGLAVKETAEDNSVTWTAADGVEYPLSFKISMNTQGGYYEEYQIRQMSYTTDRNDYPDLSDEQFANFRAITTTGMGKDKVYRSASPINPKYNRNTYADAAIKDAGVTVIMNLADDEATAKGYEGFDDTYYSEQKVIFLNMGVDFTQKDFKDKLAKGLRFFIENPGVYDIHCTEGKDRTGIVCAILECFMGASCDEVIEDYAVTFNNYYGVKPGDDKYTFVANSVIKNLEKAFGISDADSANLMDAADEYLTSIGLSLDEKNVLRTCLGDAEVEAKEDAEAEAEKPAEEAAEATEEVKPAENAEATEETKNTEEGEAAEEAKNAENAEAAEETKPAENAEATEEAKTTKDAEATEEAKPAEEAETTEEAKPAEEAEATEEAKNAENAEATEEAKPAEEAEATEEAKNAENAEATEEAKNAENAEATEEAKNAEEAETTEEVTEAEEETSYRIYTVQEGDYIIKIATEQLGDANRWAEIYELNKDIIKNPKLIYPGQELKLAE